MFSRAIRYTLFVLCTLSCLAVDQASAHERAPQVVVSIRPIYGLTAAVMDGVGTPRLLVQGNATPHFYLLRPSQNIAVEQADLVIWIGPEMEQFLTRVLGSRRGKVLALGEAPGIELLKRRAAVTDLHFGDNSFGNFHAHAPGKPSGQEAHSGHEAQSGPEEHSGQEAQSGNPAAAREAPGAIHAHEGPYDMHIWLDPVNALKMVDAIALALSEVDPLHQAEYLENANKFKQKLTDLRERLDAKLAPLRERPFVVYHDGYQYFQARFALNMIGTLTNDPEQFPGAARLKRLARAIERRQVSCLLAEEQFSPRSLRAIEANRPFALGTLDPLGTEIPLSPNSYIELLDRLADQFVKCLGAT